MRVITIPSGAWLEVVRYWFFSAGCVLAQAIDGTSRAVKTNNSRPSLAFRDDDLARAGQPGGALHIFLCLIASSFLTGLDLAVVIHGLHDALLF